MIKIQDLDFSYGNLKILKKINIDVEKNEFVGIIGPNGSGKSTLLKNISNILKPESGLIYLDYKLLNKYKPRELARQMAVVPQETLINFNFNVYDLIMMGRNPYQDRWGRITEEDKRIVDEALKLTDTDKFKLKKVNELSGGERQRVIIARALAQKPEILLLDEPTSSLDINYQGEIFDLLSYLNKELNITIITVSHDLNLTGQYCDRIILIQGGSVFTSGTPDEVLTADNIGKVYKTEVIIKESPLTGRPYVTLIPRSYNRIKNREKNITIHLVCGGGTGKELMDKLYGEGFNLTCGVLNQGDADWELAKRLNLETVEIPPFVPIEKEKLQENRDLMEKADIILVCDTPFGYGNLGNLRLVANLKDKDVILYEKRNFAERDYTDGLACEYWNQIIKKENTFKTSRIQDLIQIINKLD